VPSGDDVRRLSELFAFRPHVVEFFEKLGQLDTQLRVVLLQLTTLRRVVRRRLLRRLTTQQRLFLLAMTLRLHVRRNNYNTMQ